MFGFVLHPFKQRVTQLILNWLTSLKDSRRPAIIEVFFLPISLVNYCLTKVGAIIIQYRKLLGFILFALLFLHLTLYYFDFAQKVWLIITSILQFIFNLLMHIQYIPLYILFTFAGGHLGLLCFSYNANTKVFLIRSTPPIWIVLFCKVLLDFSTVGTLFLIILILMLTIGVAAKFYGINPSKVSGDRTDGVSSSGLDISFIKTKIWNFILSLLPSHSDEEEELIDPPPDFDDNLSFKRQTVKDKSSTLVNGSSPQKDEGSLQKDESSPQKDESLPPVNENSSQKDESSPQKDESSPPVNESSLQAKTVHASGMPDDQGNLNKSNLDETKSTIKVYEKPPLGERRLFKRKSFRRSSLSDIRNNLSTTYLYGLVWICFLAQIYLRPHLLYLLPIPISFYIMKWLFNAIQKTKLFLHYSNKVASWFKERREVICNPVFSFIYEYLLISDLVLSRALKNTVDWLSSIVVIFGLILFLIFGTIFLTVQIYHESALLVELTTNVMPTINSALANNTEFGQMLPKDLIANNVAQEIFTKGYLHGREWLQTNIRQIFGDENPDSNVTQQIENQLLEIWDRVYHVWLRPHESENCTEDTLHGPVRLFEKYNWDKLLSALKTLNLALSVDVVRENFDIIFSVFESIWSVLKGNLRLMAGTLSAILSVLFTGSTAILNVSLSFIVFFTSLFYLLLYSGQTYKPMAMAVQFISLICSSENVNVSRFEKAVEDSITSIFKATFKISLFYGLYAWLLLTLSESSIIYIPAVLAALLAAVPFIHPSLVAFIPAILEYWLVYSSGGKALLLLFFALLPMYFVDAEIYSEIKG